MFIAYTVSIHSPKPGSAKALLFHVCEVLGVLNMAMFLSAIYIHSGFNTHSLLYSPLERQYTLVCNSCLLLLRSQGRILKQHMHNQEPREMDAPTLLAHSHPPVFSPLQSRAFCLGNGATSNVMSLPVPIKSHDNPPLSCLSTDQPDNHSLETLLQ